MISCTGGMPRRLECSMQCGPCFFFCFFLLLVWIVTYHNARIHVDVIPHVEAVRKGNRKMGERRMPAPGRYLCSMFVRSAIAHLLVKGGL